MAHRDARVALRDEREAILARLAALEVLDAEEERAALVRRLDAVRRSLEQASPVARSPLLRSLRIVQACPASWAGMEGDHRVRHCSQCDRSVYDLTALMPEEVEAFLRTQRESPCESGTQHWMSDSGSGTSAHVSTAHTPAPLSTPPVPCSPSWR